MRRVCCWLAIVATIVALPAAGAAEETATGRLWDWRLSQDPARVLASVYAEPPRPGSVLLVLEPTPLAARFWLQLATPPAPTRMVPTAVWLTGRGATDISCVQRESLFKQLAAVRTVKSTPTQPAVDTLNDASRWAAEHLPAPCSILMVTTRFDFARKGLEALIEQSKSVDTRISVVCPEAAFSDNANLLMNAREPAGEAPMEEVGFDWDVNLPALWLAPVGWTSAQADMIPDDVRYDPWRMLPFVRGRGYGFVPSGFAPYPISRVAHGTGGRVFLHGYKTPPKSRCTFEMDPGLYRGLAPSVQAERAYRTWRNKDPIARIHDRSLAILSQAPGVLARNPRRERPDGSIKGFKPLPTRFDSNGDLDDALALAKRKDALARKALLHLGRVDNSTGKAVDSPRFRAHCVLLMTWLQRVRFHLGQYMLTVKRLRAEDRLASAVHAGIRPKVLWKFCYGVRGANQRTLGYRPGPGVEEQLGRVVESAMRVGRRYRYTPWEAASKLGFLVTYVEWYGDGRVRGPAPAPKIKDRNKPTTPSAKDPGKAPRSKGPVTPPPKPQPPKRPGVGGGGTGGAVTGE